MGLTDVANILNKYDNFLISSHKRPEGDSIGSEMAMYLILKKLNKKAVIVNEDSVPENLDFIRFTEIKKMPKVKRLKFDAVIILDCGNLERIGKTDSLPYSRPIINIDHHISNIKFGDAHWIDPASSSTAEMLFFLAQHLQVPLDKKIALSIYVGILTDTGAFRFSNTTARTMHVCSKLLEFDIKPEQIADLIYNRRSFAMIRLLGEALSNLKTDFNGQIAWIKITNAMLQDTKSETSDSEYFFEFIRMIEAVEASIIFSPLGDNKTKVSLRSKGDLDVGKIASFFNGGGHKLASGAEIEGSCEEVELKVIKKIKEELKKFKCHGRDYSDR